MGKMVTTGSTDLTSSGSYITLPFFIHTIEEGSAARRRAQHTRFKIHCWFATVFNPTGSARTVRLYIIV
jgi:hypothetical protein